MEGRRRLNAVNESKKTAEFYNGNLACSTLLARLKEKGQRSRSPSVIKLKHKNESKTQLAVYDIVYSLDVRHQILNFETQRSSSLCSLPFKPLTGGKERSALV